MSDRRRIVFAIAGGMFAPVATLDCAFAQKADRIYRIGVLQVTSLSDLSARQRLETFSATLRELGYVEGKNVVYEVRSADARAERLASLAKEIVARNVDVILTDGGDQAIVAARDATRVIPVVFNSAVDPVGQGLVASLARPGGNLTGMSIQSPEVIEKRLELLLETIPGAKRVGYLSADPPGQQSVTVNIGVLLDLGKRIGIEIQPIGAGVTGEFKPVFLEMVEKKIDGVIVSPTSRLVPHAQKLAGLAVESKLPMIADQTIYAENGALLSFGASRLEMCRRAASMVDKILKGTTPAAIPVEQPTRFEVVVNMRTAKALGLKIPSTVLARADRLIK